MKLNMGPVTNRNWSRILTNVAAAITVAVILSGCLLSRVLETKSQFCEYDAHFGFTVTDRAVFEFKTPVFLPADMETLIGFEPGRISESDQVLAWHYEVEKVSDGSAPVERYPGDLYFNRIDGDFRLARVEFPSFIGAMVSNEDLAETAREICDTNITSFSRSVEEDISDENMEQLPSKQMLLDWIGAPTELVDEGKGLYYEYVLVGQGEPVTVSEFTIWYEAGDSVPSRMQSSTRRMETKADFAKRKMTFRYRS